MKGVRLMAICSWQPNGRKSNVCRYEIVTTSAEHVHGKARSTTPFGHALFDKLVYVINFSEFIQALNTRQNMFWETFPDCLLVVNTALMRKKCSTDMMKFVTKSCSPLWDWPLRSWSDRSRFLQRMRSNRNNASWPSRSCHQHWSYLSGVGPRTHRILRFFLNEFINRCGHKTAQLLQLIPSNVCNETNIINEVNWPLYAPYQ